LSRKQTGLLVAVLVGTVLSAGCRQDMHDQPKIQPYEESVLHEGRSSSRAPVSGTVARGHLNEDQTLTTGIGPDGAFAVESPMPVTTEFLQRGRQRYDIFCSPCHDRTGSGQGMIVRRGYTPATSFHDPRIRNSPLGRFVDVMTNGFGEMPSYAAQVPPEDRWAIAAYVRVLQLSQGAQITNLPEYLQQAVAVVETADATDGAAEHETGGHE